MWCIKKRHQDKLSNLFPPLNGESNQQKVKCKTKRSVQETVTLSFGIRLLASAWYILILSFCSTPLNTSDLSNSCAQPFSSHPPGFQKDYIADLFQNTDCNLSKPFFVRFVLSQYLTRRGCFFPSSAAVLKTDFVPKKTELLMSPCNFLFFCLATLHHNADFVKNMRLLLNVGRENSPYIPAVPKV